MYSDTLDSEKSFIGLLIEKHGETFIMQLLFDSLD